MTLIAFFFNNLGILIKMQAGSAIMHSSAAALAHEEGNMIRLSILESRKQWDLEGKFCKWIDIFQYVDLFQSKMNHLFNSLLIHLYWKKIKYQSALFYLKAPQLHFGNASELCKTFNVCFLFV